MHGRTVAVAALAEAVALAESPLALLGDQGGVSLITGDIIPSGPVHGTVYLDAEGEVEVAPAEG